MHRLQPVDEIVLAAVGEDPGADAAGDDDDVGLGHLVVGVIDTEAEEPVVGSDLALAVADEGHGGPR